VRECGNRPLPDRRERQRKFQALAACRVIRVTRASGSIWSVSEDRGVVEEFGQRLAAHFGIVGCVGQLLQVSMRLKASGEPSFREP